MTENTTYILRAPANDEEWRMYHAIRREILFEKRGLFGVYDDSHPDEFAEGHYPLLLIRDAELIGVIRIDVDGRLAIFRRVAIRENLQRRGHGRALLSLAEDFARAKGCSLVKSYVDPTAVGFYERCGFNKSTSTAAVKHDVVYGKLL